MIYRASNKRKCEHARFFVALQQFTIIDCDGNIMRKPDVFEQLFDEDTDDQVQINLLINNIHGRYMLITREGYNEAINSKEFIEDKIRDVMKARSMALVRRMGLSEHLDLVVKYMTEAMIDAFENHTIVNEMINAAVKE
jgi:hypothetical protein